MDNVENHILYEKSAKNKIGFRVDDRKKHPQMKEVIHLSPIHERMDGRSLWIKKLKYARNCEKYPDNHQNAYLYTVYKRMHRRLSTFFTGCG